MNQRLLAAIVALAFISAGFAAAPSDWTLVRSVPTSTGGIQNYIVVPAEKQRDLAYHRAIADNVCGSRTACMAFFWTSPENIPSSVSFNSGAMRTLTAQYERHPNYREPHLRLACRLYPSKEVGEKANCFYMPGAEVPPPK